MMASDEDVIQERAVERLLSKAPPRPMPPADETAAVRDAVRAEWKTMTVSRRRRRGIASLAAAATVVLAVGVTVYMLRVPSAIVEPVATVQKAVGSLYFLGDGSELTRTHGLAELGAGQTLVTGKSSGAGLTWRAGGILRIDAETRVTFLSPTEIELHSGRIYFDSQPSSLYAGITQSSTGSLAIRTRYGVVTHVGTQYMTGINAAALTVSVREGRVQVDSGRYTGTAGAGQRLRVTGSARPGTTNFPTHGSAWEWVERTAPAPDVDRRSIHEFLRWVSRESGLQLRFEGSAEVVAREATLVASVDRGPRESLRLLLDTTALKAEIDNGWIVVSER